MQDDQVKPTPLKFNYKNWQGEVAIRNVMPIKIWYGHTEFYPTDRWLLKATDLDKNAERDFALESIIEFNPIEV
jgi:hypothetical protein